MVCGFVPLGEKQWWMILLDPLVLNCPPFWDLLGFHVRLGKGCKVHRPKLRTHHIRPSILLIPEKTCLNLTTTNPESCYDHDSRCESRTCCVNSSKRSRPNYYKTSSPRGPCRNTAYTYGPKGSPYTYFEDQVYILQLHGPFGF